LLFSYQQHHRYLAQNTSNKQSPGRIRRFLRWFIQKPEQSKPITSTISQTTQPEIPLTAMQRVKRFLALAPMIDRFLVHSSIITDEDLSRLISKIGAITIYTFIGITALGTFGVDTKPLLAGLGITGFTIGFALKEVATNFISGIFLVINKPFVRGCRIKIHGDGGGIEGKFLEFSILF
jgi:small-conductance mechanosensitive channel